MHCGYITLPYDSYGPKRYNESTFVFAVTSNTYVFCSALFPSQFDRYLVEPNEGPRSSRLVMIRFWNSFPRSRFLRGVLRDIPVNG